MRIAVMLGVLLPLLAACRDDSGPYLEFAGGGFIFNYRIADDYYGFVAQVKKPLPDGGRLEAVFDLPGGQSDSQSTEVRDGQFQYMFRSPNLRGIEKNHPYKAVLIVRDKAGAEVARYEHSFATDVDQATLPGDPLVVGPGYQKAPAPGG